MYFQSEYKCMMALNNVLVPDGHRYISGFQQNENVHYYTLVSIFCFALFLLYLNLPNVIMMSMILMVSSVIAAGRSHFHPQRHKVLKGKLTFVLRSLNIKHHKLPRALTSCDLAECISPHKRHSASHTLPRLLHFLGGSAQKLKNG